MNLSPIKPASRDALYATLNRNGGKKYDMRIAITGASGFIGSELVKAFSDDNMQVTALTRGSVDNEASSLCKWVTIDYSIDSLVEALQGTDVVVHLAGVRGTENDYERFAENLTITNNVMESMIISGTRRIVFASSVSVYTGEEPMPWPEEASSKGYNAYGNSKAECEAAIIECAEKNGLTYGIVRIAQVMGKGERRRGMMNVFLDTARDKGTLKVMGKSVMRRQYIYIRDLVKVIVSMAVANKNLILNVGMPNAYTNLEIAQIINQVYENATPVDYDSSYPESGRSFFMDISRLKEELGFVPLDLKEAVSDYMNDNK